MKKPLRWILSILVVLLLIAGGLVIKFGYLFEFYVFPPNAEKYGVTALDQMEAQGLYTDTKEWRNAKKEAMEEIKGAKSYDDTVPALKKAIKVAGGKHSFIMDNEDQEEAVKNVKYPTVKVNSDILKIKMTEFGGNKEQARKYADIIFNALKKDNYKGVIVDFQGNTGGDMGPMTAGLSPIIEDGKIVEFVMKFDRTFPVSLKDGAVKGGGTPVKVGNIKKIKKPVAILIDDRTASSAEITALTFKGREDVNYFGQPSASYTTANNTIRLYDGRLMQITMAKIKDRTGKVYENAPIHPDVKTNHAEADAIEWILKQTKK